MKRTHRFCASKSQIVKLNIVFERRISDSHLREANYRLNAYKLLIKPLRELSEIGLKRFYVYWNCCHSYEARIEKEVMNKDYEAESKIPVSMREPSEPHWHFRKEKEQALRTEDETTI